MRTAVQATGGARRESDRRPAAVCAISVVVLSLTFGDAAQAQTAVPAMDATMPMASTARPPVCPEHRPRRFGEATTDAGQQVRAKCRAAAARDRHICSDRGMLPPQTNSPDRLAAKGLPTRITVESGGRIFETRTSTYDLMRRLLTHEIIRDHDGDGILDDVDERRLETYRYDAGGLLLELVIDDTTYGRHVERYSYDADDRVSRVAFELDLDFDGATDQSGWRSYEYDEHGRLLVFTVDGFLFGLPLKQVTRYAYDGRGNIVWLAWENDWFVDGILDSRYVERYAYDQQNNLIGLVFEDDDDGDGVLDEIDAYAYTWDAQRNLLQSDGKIDYLADGVIDERTLVTFTYDRGYLAQLDVAYDWDGDGVFEERGVVPFFYEKRADLRYFTQLSEGAAGRYVFTSVWDNQGNLVGWTDVWDDGADGIIELEMRYQASFDAHGNLLVETEQYRYEDGSVSVPLTTRYEY